MNIDIFRTADSTDMDAIVQLVNRAYRPEAGISGWTHEADLVSGIRVSAGQVAAILAKQDSVILVGFKDSEVVACVHVEKHGNNSHIGMLAVNPLLQGTGFGKQMLAYAETYAREEFGAVTFVMFVLSLRNELIAFYQRRGYQKTGDITDYPLSAGVGIPKHADLKVEILEKRHNNNQMR